MGCWRTWFGVMLLFRVIFHVGAAVLAVIDLRDRNIVAIDEIAGHYVYIRATLGYIAACGATLAAALSCYPWSEKKYGRMPVYGFLHLGYFVMVVYMVFVFKVSDLSFIRRVYGVFVTTWFIALSLVLDVFTFTSAAFDRPQKSQPCPVHSAAPVTPVFTSPQPDRGFYPPQRPYQAPYQAPYQVPYQGPYHGPYPGGSHPGALPGTYQATASATHQGSFQVMYQPPR